ncbi:hypothetical protein DFH11DRAFT_1549681 [Phellopilus nigrolimitatus]|nr:hypothetical protein DFH11DRAFT_1549681 [Phellopilus nigrolimitatus]
MKHGGAQSGYRQIKVEVCTSAANSKISARGVAPGTSPAVWYGACVRLARRGRPKEGAPAAVCTEAALARRVAAGEDEQHSVRARGGAVQSRARYISASDPIMHQEQGRRASRASRRREESPSTSTRTEIRPTATAPTPRQCIGEYSGARGGGRVPKTTQKAKGKTTCGRDAKQGQDQDQDEPEQSVPSTRGEPRRRAQSKGRFFGFGRASRQSPSPPGHQDQTTRHPPSPGSSIECRSASIVPYSRSHSQTQEQSM